MLTHGVSATKNPRFRPTMEDAHQAILGLVNPGDGYFAVFDGHAGGMAATWCAERFHKVLSKNMKRYGDNWQCSAIMAGTFEQVDSILPQVAHFDSSGCTASVAYINTNNDGSRSLCTANVGDGRIVLSNNGRAKRLSRDHRTSDRTECERIEKLGGHVLNNRVQGALAITRALGDPEFKQFVCGRPYMTETRLAEHDEDDDSGNEFLIIACDGLWDVCEDQKAVDLVRKVDDPDEAASHLIDYALKNGSMDNITCMVIRLGAVGTSHSSPKQIGGEIAASKSSYREVGDEISLTPPSLAAMVEGITIDEHDEASSQAYIRHRMPRPSTPPPDDLLAPVNSKDVEDDGHSRSSEASSRSHHQHQRIDNFKPQLPDPRYRYGARRISVPCIFDDGNGPSGENGRRKSEGYGAHAVSDYDSSVIEDD